jgi:hypothetical protein
MLNRRTLAPIFLDVPRRHLDGLLHQRGSMTRSIRKITRQREQIIFSHNNYLLR